MTFPAAVGSPIAVYLMGLGAVNPAVATGAPAAGISRVTLPVTATIGGVNASVLFAGLAPGYIGLYQVSLIVPQLAHEDYLYRCRLEAWYRTPRS